MRWHATTRRIVALVFGGLLAGGIAGLATISVAASATSRGELIPDAVFEATHFPPLLTIPGETPELVFEPHCAASGVEDPEVGCTVEGTLYARAVGRGSYVAIPLESRGGPSGQLAAEVPDTLRRASALEYYATFRSPEVEADLTVPPGGRSAPYVSRRIAGAVPVTLGRNAFGQGRRTGERVAFAPWGDGPGEAGLEAGRNLDPIGASAFDVDASGSILVLDHANRRLLRWTSGLRTPSRIPLSINGAIADLAIAGDGSFYVLETTARDGRTPMIRRFDDDGRELEAVAAAERDPAQIRMGPGGPVVLQRPSNQWMPAAVAGVPASETVQARDGRMGRPLRSGSEVVVLRQGNELRVALVARNRITRAWTITSESPLAEVQLAEPLGDRLVVVVRRYDSTSDEFAVLLLDRNGLVSRTTLASSDWAEAAPLGRFRLVGRALYRLGSSPAGVFVDRFDLEVQ